MDRRLYSFLCRATSTLSHFCHSYSFSHRPPPHLEHQSLGTFTDTHHQFHTQLCISWATTTAQPQSVLLRSNMYSFVIKVTRHAQARLPLGKTALVHCFWMNDCVCTNSQNVDYIPDKLLLC